MARIITIVLSDDGDADPPTVYLGAIDKMVAWAAIWKAWEAVDLELVGFVVDSTAPQDLLGG